MENKYGQKKTICAIVFGAETAKTSEINFKVFVNRTEVDRKLRFVTLRTSFFIEFSKLLNTQ